MVPESSAGALLRWPTLPMTAARLGRERCSSAFRGRRPMGMTLPRARLGLGLGGGGGDGDEREDHYRVPGAGDPGGGGDLVWAVGDGEAGGRRGGGERRADDA